MNCKPGDLAVQVSCYGDGRYIGQLYRCLSSFIDGDGEPRWRVEPLSRTLPKWVAPECDDKHLRPIRDPGEDAVDETLLWLPSPSRTKETA